MTEPQYDDLAALRAALTDDDPDRRAPAYGAVMETDVEVSEVLSTDPPRDELVNAGVIPAESRRRTHDDQLEEVVALLEDILAAVQGGSS